MRQALPLSREEGAAAERRPREADGRRLVAQGGEREYVIVGVLCWCSVRCLSLMKKTHETVYPSKIAGILWHVQRSHAEPQEGGRGGRDVRPTLLKQIQKFFKILLPYKGVRRRARTIALWEGTPANGFGGK